MEEKGQNCEACFLREAEEMERQMRRMRDELQREKDKLRMMRLQLLQAQVNPHFLYNTLDSAIWLAEAGKIKDVSELLSRLSVFYQKSLSEGNDVITLKEEIQLTESYMEIQHKRFGGIMEYEIILPKELEEAWLPKFTIQPLAENALCHGVRQQRKRGKIRIECQDLEEDILIIVEDNGKGMKPERMKELEKGLTEGTGAGFGIYAVSERIKLYFGGEYGIKLHSQYEEGTCAEVRMPRVLARRKINVESISGGG